MGASTQLSLKTGKHGEASLSFLISRCEAFLFGQAPFQSACHRSRNTSFCIFKCLDKGQESIVKENKAARPHQDNENHTRNFFSFSLPTFPSLAGVSGSFILKSPFHSHQSCLQNDCLPQHLCFHCLQQENPTLFLSVTF